MLLREEDPEIDVLNGHIIATTFERYLKDTLLSVACEDFFLVWPQPSSQEIAEQQKAEMEEQQAAEKDGDEVAKSKEGKLFKTKSGQYYRIIDGKKVAVKKKKKAE